MKRPLFTNWTLLCVMFLITTNFKKASAASLSPEISSLEEVLQQSGWTMSPERSSIFKVGDIYSRETNRPIIFGDNCFQGQAREGIYESLDVVQALKVGGRVPLGTVTIHSEGTRYKQMTFAEPYVKEFSEMDLVPNQECVQFLQQRQVWSDLFIITATLSAQVKEQLCTSLGGGGKFLKFRTEASVENSCTQESEGHVVVAYKTISMDSLLGAPPVPKEVLIEHEVISGFDECPWGEVKNAYAEGNHIIVNDRIFSVQSSEEEAVFIDALQSCNNTEAVMYFHLWRARRQTAIRWGLTIVGSIYVTPWAGAAAMRARKDLIYSLNKGPQ